MRIGATGWSRSAGRATTDCSGRLLRRVSGGPGRDVLSGKARHDLLFGGLGSDVLLGGGGGDRIRGARGHDRIFGGGDRDVVHGGPGNDTLGMRDGEADQVKGGLGYDRARVDAGLDEIFGVEALSCPIRPPPPEPLGPPSPEPTPALLPNRSTLIFGISWGRPLPPPPPPPVSPPPPPSLRAYRRRDRLLERGAGERRGAGRDGEASAFTPSETSRPTTPHPRPNESLRAPATSPLPVSSTPPSLLPLLPPPSPCRCCCSSRSTSTARRGLRHRAGHSAREAARSDGAATGRAGTGHAVVGRRILRFLSACS